MESRRPRPQAKEEGPAGRGSRQEGERPVWQQRVARDKDVEKSPLIPSEITPEDLDMGARVQLKTLTAENAEMTARHLAMVSLLIDQDPELAHKHAQAAARRAGRLAIVHETLGITAYKTEDFALALRELLTHRRLTGSNDQLPLIVDSERGMGRPEKALEAISGVDRAKLPVGVRINLAIVVSGARLDLGQAKQAKQELEIPELSPKTVYPQSPLLFRSYAEVLRELGQDADEWERLADRAQQALDNADGEVFELFEEIVIPSSEQMEASKQAKVDKAKRFLDKRGSAGDSQRPRRDGDKPFRKRPEGDRPERPYRPKTDSDSAAGERPRRPYSPDSGGKPERKFPDRGGRSGGNFSDRSKPGGGFKPRGNRGQSR